MISQEAIRSLIQRHEGLRYSAYKDTTGNVTVGIGFNVNAAGARVVCEGFGIDYDLVLTGNTPLTEDQVMKLFDYSIDEAFATAHAVCPEFDELCENAQLALSDMAFNIGPARLGGFKRMLMALSKQDYASAASEMAESIWAGQVPSRATDDIALMKSCKL